MRVWLLAVCWLLALTGQARADERILEFFSDIKVERSGDLLVTENLRVRSEGKQIRHGLQRDFAHLYRRDDGTRTTAGFDVVSVRRDGRAEPFELSRLRDGVRVTTGRKDVVFRPGEYQYTLTYRVTRQLRAAGGQDRLVWDVTGREWALPIDKVRVRIVLPGEAPIQDAAVAGQREASGRLQEREPGRAVFVSTRVLAPGESMAVELAWPAGQVSRPGPVMTWWHGVQDRAELWVGGLGAGCLLLYYLVAWLQAGGWSRRGKTPLTEPPEGLSAPALRYVYRKGYDRWAFLSGMMELLARRSVRLRVQADGRYLERLPNQTGGDARHDPLLNGMLGRFFAGGRTLLRLDGLYRRCYDEALRDQRQWLDEAYARSLFVTYGERARKAFYLWIAMTVALVGLAIIREGSLLAWTAWGILLPLPAVPAWCAVHAQWRAGATSFVSRVVLGALALLCLAGGLAVLVTHAESLPLLLAGLAPLILLPVVCAGFPGLKGYTAQGRALRVQIDGFRRFLAHPSAASAPLDAESALARYERYLPYALALGVARRWSAAHAQARGAAPAALADMQARYGGVYDVLTRPHAVMASLDRWAARAAPVRGPRAASSAETGEGRR
ncbi:hypothetical protein CDO44_08055 [Pigmentiphaga sp. NML080357]|uniref:DUF2207 domain-containing protein n=1 Tax=Pigmentiphaga sp. NML080357 TaxID=2008675 RepID=UPI000B41E00E|nr:DUF2207 domain-containing protein [Pigmentiphaga sp. NML080357]OVZ60668.1 hypothetical protein CDO44_08055 [Pigmentiphaga sp. NML080357]